MLKRYIGLFALLLFLVAGVWYGMQHQSIKNQGVDIKQSIASVPAIKSASTEGSTPYMQPLTSEETTAKVSSGNPTIEGSVAERKHALPIFLDVADKSINVLRAEIERDKKNKIEEGIIVQKQAHLSQMIEIRTRVLQRNADIR